VLAVGKREQATVHRNCETALELRQERKNVAQGASMGAQQ